jgi:hypothetical protein
MGYFQPCTMNSSIVDITKKLKHVIFGSQKCSTIHEWYNIGKPKVSKKCMSLPFRPSYNFLQNEL